MGAGSVEKMAGDSMTTVCKLHWVRRTFVFHVFLHTDLFKRLFSCRTPPVNQGWMNTAAIVLNCKALFDKETSNPSVPMIQVPSLWTI